LAGELNTVYQTSIADMTFIVQWEDDLYISVEKMDALADAQQAE